MDSRLQINPLYDRFIVLQQLLKDLVVDLFHLVLHTLNLNSQLPTPTVPLIHLFITN